MIETIKKFLKTKKLYETIVFLSLFLTVVIFSGYTLYNNPSFRTISNVILIINFLFLLILFVLKLPLKKHPFKSINCQKTSEKFMFLYKTCVFCVFFLVFFVSFLVNREFSKEGLSSLVITTSILSFGYLFSCLIPFQSFVSIFKKVFPFICLLSLVIYIPSILGGSNSLFLPFETTDGYYYNNYIFLNFQLYSSTSRNCAIFWEPGVFAIFINIAFLFEFIKKDQKPRNLVLVLYVICLITTFSTAGYVEFFFTGIACICFCKTKKERIVYSSILVLVVVILVTIFLSSDLLNAKIYKSNKSSSFSSRVNGLILALQSITKGNFFGAGRLNANSYFINLVQQSQYVGSIDSLVGTFCYFIISYGVFGIVLYIIPFSFLFACLKIKVWQRIAIFPLLILITNVEPLNNNIFFYTMIFYISGEFIESFGKQQSLLEIPNYEDKKTIGGYIKTKIFGGNENNKVLLKNSFWSFVVRGFALLLGLFTTSSYLKYFGEKSTLGVWFILLQIIVFILTFDMGIGHGLKNRLISSLQNGKKEETQTLIVSAVVSSFAVSIMAVLVGIIIIQFLNFNNIFNISEELISATELKTAMVLIVVSIALQFVFKIIGNIFEAFQIQFASGIFAIITNFTLFIFASFAVINGGGNRLITLCIVYLVASNVPFVFGAIYLLLTKLKGYSFSFKMFNFRKAREVTSLGSKFLIIQICLLFMNSINSMILANLYTSSSVPDYTVYQKLFNVVIVVCSLLTGPIWAIVAKAKTSHEEGWIKKLSKQLFVLGIALIVVDSLLVVMLQPIFDMVFPSYELKVNWIVAAIFALHSIFMVIVGLASSICNGLEILKPQIIGSICGFVIKVGLTILQFSIPELKDNVDYWYLVQCASMISLLPSVILCAVGAIRAVKKININKYLASDNIENK